jgi:hypothetical protein
MGASSTGTDEGGSALWRQVHGAQQQQQTAGLEELQCLTRQQMLARSQIGSASKTHEADYNNGPGIGSAKSEQSVEWMACTPYWRPVPAL